MKMTNINLQFIKIEKHFSKHDFTEEFILTEFIEEAKQKNILCKISEHTESENVIDRMASLSKSDDSVSNPSPHFVK
jgi:hypothetical protein